MAGLTLGMSYMQRASATVPGTNSLISINNTGNGQGGNGNSYSSGNQGSPMVSADGNYVAFVSDASDLISGDTNANSDIFVRNIPTGTTTRVDVSSSGVQANAGVSPSVTPAQTIAISRTGRYVAFVSAASNLIDGQTITTVHQVYLHDMQTGTTTLVPQTTSGTVANAVSNQVFGISSDGRFVLFESDANNLGPTASSTGYHLYRLDRQSGNFQILNEPLTPPPPYHAQVQSASMSCDGSIVVENEFQAALTPDDTNTFENVYMTDFRNGQTLTDLSANATSSTFSPRISCDGDYITFDSYSHVFTPTLITNDLKEHLYLYDRINGTYTLVDQSTGGVPASTDVNGAGAVDDNGNVLFASSATNLSSPAVSPSQIWLHTYATGATELVSKNSAGIASNSGIPSGVSLTSNGKLATYYAGATNLISSDTNGKVDVFTSLTGL